MSYELCNTLTINCLETIKAAFQQFPLWDFRSNKFARY